MFIRSVFYKLFLEIAELQPCPDNDSKGSQFQDTIQDNLSEKIFAESGINCFECVKFEKNEEHPLLAQMLVSLT